MEENKKEDHFLSEARKDTSRKRVFWVTTFIAGLASISAIISLLILSYNTFCIEPTVRGYYATYMAARVASYSGELVNESSFHAGELTFKGRLNAKVIDLAITTSDSIEKKVINNPIGSVEFSLKRLSARNTCQFDVIVGQGCEIIENFKISWGKKGYLVLAPEKSDSNIRRGVELGERLSDLSRKARQRWFENNSKDIRK
ncbi:MAG: hypothetical protein ACLQGU_01940 [bacterium]